MIVYNIMYVIAYYSIFSFKSNTRLCVHTSAAHCVAWGCKGQRTSTKVINSGFNNSAGFQRLTSGSQVAHACELWFEICAIFVLPTFCQGGNPAGILSHPCKRICCPPYVGWWGKSAASARGMAGRVLQD